MAEVPSVAQPTCLWSDGSRKFEIYLRPSVMGRLGTESWVAFKRVPRRGLEIGGVLLGRIERDEDSTTFWIEGFAAVESEHRSGPSYVLSESDLERLQDEIRKNGSASIGIFRSQTRSEQLVIQEPDAALLERYFDPIDALFLMVGPVPGKAALFIRTNGHLSCVHEFPLTSLSSALKGSQNLRSQEADPPANPGPEIRRAVTRLVRQPEAPVTRLETPKVDASGSVDPHLDRPADPPPSSPHEHPQETPGKKNTESLETAMNVTPAGRSGVKRAPWILAATLAVLLVTAALSVRSNSSLGSSAPGSSAPARSALEFIQLGVDREGTSLRIHWDRNSPALRDATRAVLHVQDGEIQVDRILTASDLSSGSAAYEPKNAELAFRLDVYSANPRATGLVQVMNLPAQLEIPQARPAEPRIQPEPRRAESTRPSAPAPGVHPEPVTAQPITPKDETVEIPPPVLKASYGTKQEIPVAAPKPPDKTETKSSDALDSSSPKAPESSSPPRVVIATERAVPIRNVSIPNVPIRNGGPSVSVLAEPVSGSKLGRVVGKVPLLRRLKSHDNFVAPVPIYQAQPSLKLPNQQRLTQLALVDVKVDVAESGKVKFAEITEFGDPPNFSLANAALAAARQWTFTPARAEDLPVSSQVVLHFRFNP